MGIFGGFTHESNYTSNETVVDKDSKKTTIDEDDDKNVKADSYVSRAVDDGDSAVKESANNKKNTSKSRVKKNADKALDGVMSDCGDGECGECSEASNDWENDPELASMLEAAKSKKKKVKEKVKKQASKYKKAAKEKGADDEEIDDKLDKASDKATDAAEEKNKKSKKKKGKDDDSESDEDLAESYMLAAMKEAVERMNGKVIKESTSFSSKYANTDKAIIESLVMDLMIKPIPKKKGLREATRLKLKPDFEYPYKNPMYNQVVREYMDLKDHNTRIITVSVNEEDQSRLVTALTGKLYDLIVDKVDDIDFGDIPKSRGDITLVQNYDKITECLEIINELLINYKQPTDTVDTVNEAINNIKERVNMFKKAFNANVELPMVMYNTMVMAIIASTSLMISTSIEFIKNPGDETFKVSLDRVGMNRSRENMLFENLEKFNAMCKSKKFDETMDTVIANSGKHNLLGAEVTTVAAIAAGTIILFNILPILRELTYFFFYSKVRVSDYFNLQADLLQLNAENLKHSNREVAGSDKDKVIKRQLGVAKRFRQLADFLAVDAKKSDVSSTKAIQQDTKKIKADEVMDTLPDSTASALF